jgi:hypothetical protein
MYSNCVCVCVCVNLFKDLAKFNLLLEFQLILSMLKLTLFLVCLIYKTFLCVYVQASSKWFLDCHYKVNMIHKVTKSQGICFKDFCHKLLRLFTHKYVNILRTVLIIESM